MTIEMTSIATTAPPIAAYIITCSCFDLSFSPGTFSVVGESFESATNKCLYSMVHKLWLDKEYTRNMIRLIQQSSQCWLCDQIMHIHKVTGFWYFNLSNIPSPVSVLSSSVGLSPPPGSTITITLSGFVSSVVGSKGITSSSSTRPARNKTAIKILFQTTS